MWADLTNHSLGFDLQVKPWKLGKADICFQLHKELLLGIQNLDEDGDAVCWPAVAVRRVKRGPGCVTAWSRVGSTQVYWAHFASNLKHATTRAYPPTKTSAELIWKLQKKMGSPTKNIFASNHHILSKNGQGCAVIWLRGATPLKLTWGDLKKILKICIQSMR